MDQLERSSLRCGGWGLANKEFFLTLTDKSAQKIGQNFQEINDTLLAIDWVAEGKFAFYENEYYLKSLSVKRQIKQMSHNASIMIKKYRQMHTMENCVINMPISIGT